MTIRILKTDEEIALAFALMSQLRTHLKAKTFVADVRAQQADGYELIGGFENEAAPIVLAGLRVGRTLMRGPHVFVDDLVTDESARSQGYRKAMLRWIAEYAAERKISHVYLDSRDTARGFYEKAGFVFSKAIPCRIETEKLRGY